jgi:hypothetical protein
MMASAKLSLLTEKEAAQSTRMEVNEEAFGFSHYSRFFEMQSLEPNKTNKRLRSSPFSLLMKRKRHREETKEFARRGRGMLSKAKLIHSA